MSFKVESIAEDQWKLAFEDEPSYVQALKIAPESMEPELNRGAWLVVTFPVWSILDRRSVAAAIACTKDYGGRFRLGVRPFDSFDRLSTWWPVGEAPSATKVLVSVQDEGSRREIHISTDTSSSPIWLVLRDGQVLHQGRGPHSKEQLSELMQRALVLPL